MAIGCKEHAEKEIASYSWWHRTEERTEAQAGIGWDREVKKIWQEIGGNQDEILSVRRHERHRIGGVDNKS